MKLKRIVLTIGYVFLSQHALATNYVNGTDITDQLNKEVQKLPQHGTLKIPAGDFKIDAKKSIILKNNMSIEMSPQTILRVIPNSYSAYRIFSINNVHDIKISGGTLIGDKYLHLGTTGQWGMGIEIKDSQNISISNMNIDQMWGDAIYIGTNIGNNAKNSNYNFSLNNLILNDNRRQGISITTVDTLKANNIMISNTGGVNPGDGIDIEPNDHKAKIKNLSFNTLKTFKNKGVGFQISLLKYNGSITPPSVSLENHIDNGSRFGMMIGGITQSMQGKITINKVDYKNNTESNFCFNKWANNQIKVNINNIRHDKNNTFSALCNIYSANPLIKIQRLY